MSYAEIIQIISNNILVNFDEVYYNAETIVNDEGIRKPAIALKDEYIPLSPSDTREIIYIRRNGNDTVLEELKLSSCSKAYKMQSPLRIVFFRDNTKDGNKILANLLQSVLITGTKLQQVIQDKWKLQKEESSGDYSFGPLTAYFAIDIYAHWQLKTDTCEQDFCIEGINPLKKNA